jgi:hypothetical protein
MVSKWKRPLTEWEKIFANQNVEGAQKTKFPKNQ